jgi:hypothetical protein
MLTWGCYTTSQHPLVNFHDDVGNLNVFSISVYDECQDCHNSESVEELRLVNIPDNEINSSFSDYYEDSDIDLYYNDNPWWQEYSINFDFESAEISSIIFVHNNNLMPVYFSDDQSEGSTSESTTKYRSEQRLNHNGDTQQKSDPNPRNRDGGGRGKSKGRK